MSARRSAAAGPGRPRDVSMDARVLSAALQVYSVQGKAGFTVDLVAKTAGCSRPAVYSRWPTKEALLLAAVRSFDANLDVPDEGSAHDQLVSVAQQLLEGFSSVQGLATFRIVLDSRDDEDLRAEWEKINTVRLRSAAEVLERGVARGEWRSDVASTEFLRSLTGAAMIEGLYTHMAFPERLQRARGEAERLVDFLLEGRRT
ncbi:TetR/AcrR family transcriptional regulator [Mycobacterium sp. CVI_P3]|uniref:TetR/AcrR family transcriptional regulator n=1 Tax=Mycobacterium pinniadriaticum TaxID=2994102 RepID=A0ABT3SBX1_9MYCO|nr:TetR/AcrR family transcriptional regulator [Mycobacterium pinniadriaticum]MCX2930597.1 TetR/AcrR family transcriptional regulator [Mycobacterium pinniadriaticum]MCX2937021.1 TetR/AcrR family transcriptional regulator [Mycobacterium pinniadriaticum]